MKIMVTGVEHIEQLLLQHPPQIKSFNKDKLYYIIHKLVGSPFMEQNLNKPVALSASILQDVIGNEYKQYLSYLEEHKIIEIDHQYIVGSRTRTYKLLPHIISKPVFYKIHKKTLSKRMAKYKKWEIGEKKVLLTNTVLSEQKSEYRPKTEEEYDYLSKWMPGLQIDAEKAENWATSYWFQKTLHPKYRDKEKYDNIYRGEPDNEYFHRLKSIEFFKSTERPFIIDSSGYRLHTLLTGCSKELRHFLHYNGQPLVGIDIKNCQPLLMSVILKPDFWTEEPSELTAFSQRALYALSIDPCLYPYMLLNLSSAGAKYEIQEYEYLSSSGQLYESLIDYLPRPLSKRTSVRKRRKTIKSRMMLFMYGDLEIKCRGVDIAFYNKFPLVGNIIFNMKLNMQSNAFALMLQRIESFLMLDHVCLTISQKHPEIPIFTIHDSIVTTTGSEEIVKGILLEEFQRVIQFTPTVEIEFYTEKVPNSLLRKIEQI